MMLNKTAHYRIIFIFALALFVMAANGVLLAQAPSVIVKWEKKIIPNHTVPTLQAVINPMLQRGSPIHDAALEALHKLGADYVRYAFWFPYPKMAVAELRPPETDQTFWDFQYMDPLVEDFLRASEGHSSVFSFSTIPQWMFATPKPIVYPDDPQQVFWDYTQGTQLTNIQAMADYY
ncbi:MAG: glycosyl hydrolase family 39, partial [Candidatus Sulfotelmatobacter sp.]